MNTPKMIMLPSIKFYKMRLSKGCFGLMMLFAGNSALSQSLFPSSIAAGDNRTCVVDNRGLVCWGERSLVIDGVKPLQVLARGTGMFIATPSGLEGDDWKPGSYERMGKWNNLRHIGIGDSFTCGIDDEGLNCYGYYPRKPEPPTRKFLNPRKIEGGYSHHCVLDNFELFCYGTLFWYKRPSFRTEMPASTPQSIGQVFDFASGSNHICALTKENGIQCWGEPLEADDGSLASLVNPKFIEASISGTCVLDDRGIHCWGENFAALAFIPVDSSRVIALAVGENHLCALMDEEVKCWGDNKYGQSRPPKFFSDPSSIALGRGHSQVCGLYGEELVKDVQCYRRGGRLLTPPVDKVKSLAFGRSHGCLIDKNDRVQCFGDNEFGQTTSPVFTDPVEELCSGEYHSCSISSGNVECWGGKEDFHVKVPPHLENPRQLTCGDFTSCAVTDHGVQCWGAFVNGRYRPFSKLKNPSYLAIFGWQFCGIEDDKLKCGSFSDRIADGNYRFRFQTVIENLQGPKGIHRSGSLGDHSPYPGVHDERGLVYWTGKEDGTNSIWSQYYKKAESIFSWTSYDRRQVKGGNQICKIEDEKIYCGANGGFRQLRGIDSPRRHLFSLELFLNRIVQVSPPTLGKFLQSLRSRYLVSGIDDEKLASYLLNKLRPIVYRIRSEVFESQIQLEIDSAIEGLPSLGGTDQESETRGALIFIGSTLDLVELLGQEREIESLLKLKTLVAKSLQADRNTHENLRNLVQEFEANKASMSFLRNSHKTEFLFFAINVAIEDIIALID